MIGDHAPVYVDLRHGGSADLLRWSPYKVSPREVDEQNVMRHVVASGDIAFDIGANIGLHTVLLSQLVGPEGKVYAFEPNEELLPNLRRTVAGLGNSVLHPLALSDESLEATLYVPEDHTMANLARDGWPVELAQGTVRLMTCEERRMDDLIAAGALPPPDFIKCDVEGAELKVFQGGRETLNRVAAPVILFEANVWASESFKIRVHDAKDFLASLELPQYQFFEIAKGQLRRLKSVDPELSNILAIPQSKIGLWPELAQNGTVRLESTG